MSRALVLVLLILLMVPLGAGEDIHLKVISPLHPDQLLAGETFELVIGATYRGNPLPEHSEIHLLGDGDRILSLRRGRGGQWFAAVSGEDLTHLMGDVTVVVVVRDDHRVAELSQVVGHVEPVRVLPDLPLIMPSEFERPKMRFRVVGPKGAVNGTLSIVGQTGERWTVTNGETPPVDVRCPYAGEYGFEFRPKGRGCSYMPAEGTLRVEPPQVEYRITPTGLLVEVTHPRTGAPLPLVRIVLWDRGGWAGPWPTYPVGWTNDRGEVEFEVSDPSRYEIRVGRPVGARSVTAVEILPSLAIEAPGVVKAGDGFNVTVRDVHTGEGIVGALVTLDGEAYETDAQGVVFVVAPAGDGSFSLGVSAEGYPPQRKVIDVMGAVQPSITKAIGWAIAIAAMVVIVVLIAALFPRKRKQAARRVQPVVGMVKPPEVKPPEVKPPEVKPPEVKPPEVKPPEVKPPEVKPPAARPEHYERMALLNQRVASMDKRRYNLEWRIDRVWGRISHNLSMIDKRLSRMEEFLSKWVRE